MRQRCEGAGSRRTCAGFPGDYDAYRPSVQENVIGFGGRTGYVTTAIEAGVPIVPVVSIGGQENQLYLTRGRRLARAGAEQPGKEAVPQRHAARHVRFPVRVQRPVPGEHAAAHQDRRPVLHPIDIAAEFGDDPDVDEVDAHVRSIMQDALNELVRKRRLPVLG